MNEIQSGNVARYCKPSSLDEDGYPTGSAFQRRSNRNEEYLSVYLLEFFKKIEEKDGVLEVKREMERKNFNLKVTGSYAILNIERSKKYIMDEIEEQIYYREMKLPHCGIFHDHDDLLISELLAECIQNSYRIRDIA
jgi:hypothetical protein